MALKLQTETVTLKLSDLHLPGSREAVGGMVDDFGLKDLAGLLSDTLAEVLVVHLDAGDVACVSWDHS